MPHGWWGNHQKSIIIHSAIAPRPSPLAIISSTWHTGTLIVAHRSTLPALTSKSCAHASQQDFLWIFWRNCPTKHGFSDSLGTLPVPNTAVRETTHGRSKQTQGSEYSNENINVAMVILEQGRGRNRNICIQLGVFYSCIEVSR
jgi:hypothetical protein